MSQDQRTYTERVDGILEDVEQGHYSMLTKKLEWKRMADSPREWAKKIFGSFTPDANMLQQMRDKIYDEYGFSPLDSRRYPNYDYEMSQRGGNVIRGTNGRVYINGKPEPVRPLTPQDWQEAREDLRMRFGSRRKIEADDNLGGYMIPPEYQERLLAALQGGPIYRGVQAMNLDLGAQVSWEQAEAVERATERLVYGSNDPKYNVYAKIGDPRETAYEMRHPEERRYWSGVDLGTAEFEIKMQRNLEEKLLGFPVVEESHWSFGDYCEVEYHARRYGFFLKEVDISHRVDQFYPYTVDDRRQGVFEALNRRMASRTVELHIQGQLVSVSPTFYKPEPTPRDAHFIIDGAAGRRLRFDGFISEIDANYHSYDFDRDGHPGGSINVHVVSHGPVQVFEHYEMPIEDRPVRKWPFDRKDSWNALDGIPNSMRMHGRQFSLESINMNEGRVSASYVSEDKASMAFKVNNGEAWKVEKRKVEPVSPDAINYSGPVSKAEEVKDAVKEAGDRVLPWFKRT